MLRRRTRVHEGLSDDRQAGVGDAALVDVEHKLRILYDVHPEPERKAEDTGDETVTTNRSTLDDKHLCLFSSPVALPGVSDIRVADLPFVRLLVQEVEHVLDGQRQGGASVGRAEHRFKQVVHKLLQRPLVVGGPKRWVQYFSGRNFNKDKCLSLGIKTPKNNLKLNLQYMSVLLSFGVGTLVASSRVR